eukprot:m.51572 g.51572  ORF g.51572 m.51572 type:complete len:1018 (+) comp10741_c0_seq1:186-3239(+)
MLTLLLFVAMMMGNVPSIAADNTAVVAVGNATYRVQALSSTLVRIEAQGPKGFEDRLTYMVQNRSFPGLDVHVTNNGSTTVQITTSAYVVELSPPGKELQSSRNGLSVSPRSACRNPVSGMKPVNAILVKDQSAAKDVTSKSGCCAACSTSSTCTAWTFAPASVQPSTKGLRAADCNASSPGQQWTLKVDTLTTIASHAMGTGCWEINGCATGNGAQIATPSGCKPLNPKATGCDANSAWTYHSSNGSITSQMDGNCVTLSGSSPVVSKCDKSDKSQVWKVSQDKSAFSITSSSGKCLDNSPSSPIVTPAKCTLIESMDGIQGGGAQGETLGGMRADGPANLKGQCSVTIKSSAGALLYHSPSFDTSSSSLQAPEPALIQNNSYMAIKDAPRFVPPTGGAIPPAKPVPAPLANTSGYDVTNHADDLYVFLFSNGYPAMRQEFLSLTGAVPTLPDWAFGLWFCWYHPYNQSEKTAEIQRFLDDNLGLEVASLDRDWRELGLPAEATYKENTTLFPDMDGFLDWVHQKKLHIFFNDHPKPLDSGTSGAGSSDPNVVLAPAEIEYRWKGLTSWMDRGLDFWWYDCHWAWFEPSLTLPNGAGSVDGVTWGQSVFQDIMTAYDKMRPNNKSNDITPFGMGCSGSSHPASHRYPTHWTGDIYNTDLTNSIADMIIGGYETFTPYVHPDCTAHHGHDDPEVYIRWIQFCSLGTIMRVHSDPYNDRRPWAFGEDIESIFRAFVQMRQRLSPSFTSAAIQASMDATPLVQRLDYVWPSLLEATRNDQFLLLGRDTLVAPIDPFAGTGCNQTGYNRSRTVWVPPGEWVDAFSGSTITGPTELHLQDVPVAQMPLYHRKGGLIVTTPYQISQASELDDTFLALQTWMPNTSQRYTKMHLQTQPHSAENIWETPLSVEYKLSSNVNFSSVNVVIGQKTLKHVGYVSTVTCSWLLRMHHPHGLEVENVYVNGISTKEYHVVTSEAGSRSHGDIFGTQGTPSTAGFNVLELKVVSRDALKISITMRENIQS